MKRSYRPSISSLFFSFLWGISPAVVALVGYLIAHEEASDKGLIWFLVVVSVAMCFWSVLLIIQTIAVHMRRVTIDEKSITVAGPLGTTTIAFSSVAEAILRERVNPISRTDHLIMIRSHSGGFLVYNPSALSRSDEESFLSLLRRHVDLKVISDKPAL